MRRANRTRTHDDLLTCFRDVSEVSLARVARLKLYTRSTDTLLVLHQLDTASDGVGANLQARMPVLRQFLGEEGVKS